MKFHADELLRWVSEVGSTTLESFGEACESLSLNRWEALRTLDGLGHLEADRTARRVAVPPVTAVELPGLADRVFLTGARNSDLDRRIESAVARSELDVDPAISYWPQGIQAPATALVAMDVAQMGEFCDLLGIANGGVASKEIARLLPAATVETSTIQADPDLRFPHARVSPDTLAARWSDSGASLSPGLWRFLDHGRRRTAVLIGEDLTARRFVDPSYAPFVAFRHEGSVDLIEFRKSSSTLTVDARTPLPDLHHRALCLASGRAPVRQYLGPDLACDEYLNVDAELAGMICKSLLGEAENE